MPIPFIAPLIAGGAKLLGGAKALGGLMGGLGGALGGAKALGGMLGGGKMLGGMLGGLPGLGLRLAQGLGGAYKKHRGPLPPGGLLLASMLGNMGAALGGKGSFADRLNPGAQDNIKNMAYARQQKEMLERILAAIKERQESAPPADESPLADGPAQTQQVPRYYDRNPAGATLVADTPSPNYRTPGYTRTPFGPQAPGTILM